jgi:hypothetical protein
VLNRFALRGALAALALSGMAAPSAHATLVPRAVFAEEFGFFT